ncbi:cell division protein FtsZ [Aureibaculum sp. 2210JD6-5]|uniref:cell division protein FtsZ n=1 Tax=Aureibaculum sp. 2210JD6-5 TaxID=3103957 RepID=UPI002AAEF390|nr:cell division protein FtsZ [Aureibaculum sp. 2210JD6-5]MDY7394520.1 cell division protein FtsZ [Aureibaculum sp. 2210JD6-5]
MSTEFENLAFDLPKNQSSVIKVIGVGGGGSNAVNHMFKKGVAGIDFVICNTDEQALHNSPVTNKIQLGVSLTEGLGAGANPEVGEEAALESIEEIKAMLSTRAKMVFITVGMGGGTGTGAAPIIAKAAKEMDLLTVGIVTIPFSFEGKMRNDQAQKGIEKLSKHIDSLVVINNNKLREVYGNLGFKAGFSKADEVLSTAAMGIAEVITHHYTQNIDLKDAKTVLSNSGTAIMGSAIATGQNRAQEAITKALDSPLLNDNKITGAKNVLLLIVSGTTEITIDEIGEINDYIQSEAKSNVDIIMGVGEDVELGESIAVTIIATGFNKEQQREISHTEAPKIVHDLEPSKFYNEPIAKEEPIDKPIVKHKLELDNDEIEVKTSEIGITPKSEAINNMDVIYDDVNGDEDLDEFVIKPVAKKEEINEMEPVETQGMLTFDLPLTPKRKAEESDTEQSEVRHSLSASSIRDIEVIDPLWVKPTVTFDGKIKHGLENFMDDDVKKNAKPSEEVKDEELVFNVRVEKKEVENKESTMDEEESPLSLTIEELQKRADDRRKKMKDFNYRFTNRPSNNEEYQSKPAYKRMGVDLDDIEPSSEPTENKSRISLSSDDNDDIQLRSNNSYLHDNVD